MSLHIYNTLSRKKEEFKPLTEGAVNMYCCGPTVYDYLHVGNFRGAVFYNLVRNWLEKSGYKVQYAYNFTDVDDKILNRAKDENVSPREVAERYIEEFKKDYSALELKAHDLNPKVTESMAAIIKTIETLIEKGHAYEVDGEVLYSIESFKEYGKLSGRKVDDLLSGVRIEVNEHKKNPLDFALWKPAKEGEESWDSPWGPGRPGWHIECTSMIQKHFGDQIDIHGGGLDLAFPHHENELAQAEGCSGLQYVKYWMHNNMFTFGGTKMSKSLGNVRTMRSFLEKFHGEIFKYLTLSVHYRSEADFTDQTIHQAIKGLAKFYSAIALADSYLEQTSVEDLDLNGKFKHTIDEAQDRIDEALNDDFNTPEVFARFFEIIRQFNTQIRPGMKLKSEQLAVCYLFKTFITSNGELLSLFQKPAKEFLLSLDNLLLKQMELDRKEVDELVEKRWVAKQSKDYEAADMLRAKLTEMGIAVQDTPQGSQWEVAK